MTPPMTNDLIERLNMIVTELQGLPHVVQTCREAAAHIEALAERVREAQEIARDYGSIDGSHHKMWVIDQMVRALTGVDYAAWVAEHNDGEDGPDTYEWDEGIEP